MTMGLYVHIPFCARKCRYCDFVSFPDKISAADAYLDALGREAAEYKGAGFDTVFIGGGTPSVLSEAQLSRLFEIINTSFKIASDAEFTIEVNPGTLDDKKIAAMLSGGVNRVSVGVQSFNDAELSALGRIHSEAEAENAVKTVRAAGIDNINIDLMTATPCQTRKSLMESLKTAMSLPVTHISAYSLILEEGTPLYKDYKNGAFAPVDEDEDRDMYAALVNTLSDGGFKRYEISNFAKEGFECRHNIKYWKCREYVGLGLAAHSYIGGKRFSNTENFEKYIIGDFRSGDAEILSRADMAAEFVIMGLRMTRGVSEAEFLHRFGTRIEDIYGAQLEKFKSLSLITHSNGRYFLTSRGLDVSNTVMSEFIPD